MALGCTVAQGFLWSPAVPGTEIAALASAGAPRRRSGRVQWRGERNLIDELLHQIGVPRESL